MNWLVHKRSRTTGASRFTQRHDGLHQHTTHLDVTNHGLLMSHSHYSRAIGRTARHQLAPHDIEAIFTTGFTSRAASPCIHIYSMNLQARSPHKNSHQEAFNTIEQLTLVPHTTQILRQYSTHHSIITPYASTSPPSSTHHNYGPSLHAISTYLLPPHQPHPILPCRLPPRLPPPIPPPRPLRTHLFHPSSLPTRHARSLGTYLFAHRIPPLSMAPRAL